MGRLRISALAGPLLVAASSSGPVAAPAPDVDPAALSAGVMTTLEAGAGAYEQLSPLLTSEQAKLVADGRTFFETKWAFYWFEQGLWGRGPTSNAESCAACHRGNGRGAPPSGQEAAVTMVVQISLPGTAEDGGPNPHPNYGRQLQSAGVPRLIVPEAQIFLDWRERTVTLADGETVLLREPALRIAELGYGPLSEPMHFSARVAPPVMGMGLLDSVGDETILALAARAPSDGIRGRVNRVRDVGGKRRAVGRFGLKANHPSLRQQVAAAFIEDIGLSTSLFPDQNCPGMQAQCREMMVAGKPEITDYRLKAVESLMRYAAVPARRDLDDAQVRRGEALFAEARCSACHVPELRTARVPGEPALSEQTIRPYTDLLLHDMGEGLADGRPDFEAGPRDWRTTPLWGVGLSRTVNGNANLLHDGRARSIEEAVLWHGGEAEISRGAFAALPRADREALVRFVESL
jgi:CxxC motif-containing protein (DUF1111 family)